MDIVARFWDRDFKKMIYSKDNYKDMDGVEFTIGFFENKRLNNNTLQAKGHIEYKNEEGDVSPKHWCIKNVMLGVILNGVEIYDQDIIEYEGVNYVVSFDLFGLTFSTNKYIAKVYDEIKVVGNAYENEDMYKEIIRRKYRYA